MTQLIKDVGENKTIFLHTIAAALAQSTIVSLNYKKALILLNVVIISLHISTSDKSLCNYCWVEYMTAK